MTARTRRRRVGTLPHTTVVAPGQRAPGYRLPAVFTIADVLDLTASKASSTSGREY